ncbi:hypothetical protein SteCoe_3977 [Stentor coeruleus]|uniref:PIPK domain-containing protein n=1 Tax=Stentor coeruleus TaxID=5963 RepID=A0A1R2CVX9_9CILI|nr:hypothetical protein SteCoe_3977 [Stentor coeruleus]
MYYLIFDSLIILICIMKYFRKRFIAKSKDIINLIIISIILIATTIFGSSFSFLSRTEIDRNTKYYISLTADILYASIGIFQFCVLALDKKFRQKIKSITIEGSKKLRKTFGAKKLYKISTIGNDKTLTDGIIDPNDYMISQLKSGNLCEIFENITKNSLIYVFIVISLKFLKNKRVVENKYMHFFETEDLEDLYQAIEINFVQRISLRSLELKEYFAEEFEYLRSVSNLENINSSLINLQNYFKLVNLLCEQGGRSDSFIYSTYDNKFIIKTIKKSEAKLFLNRFLPTYLSRVHNSSSKLSRIYGAFKVYPQKQYVILMENILYNKDKSLIFDIKGSKLDREVKNILDPKNPPVGTIMKDINFIKFEYRFDIENIVKESIIESLIQDFLVLKDAGIMDYSILLGICKEIQHEEEVELNRYSLKMKNGDIVSIGIIDLLQVYNLSKFSEKSVKAIFNKKENISSANPEDYFMRICQFTREIFSSE